MERLPAQQIYSLVELGGSRLGPGGEVLVWRFNLARLELVRRRRARTTRAEVFIQIQACSHVLNASFDGELMID